MIDEIRRARVEDYDSIVAINNATWPQYKTTKQEMLQDDRVRKGRHHFARLVLVRSGEIVGVGQYDQFQSDEDPYTYWIEVNVHPNYQKLGIGRALYAALMEDVEPANPRHFRLLIRDDNLHAIDVFLRRGFYVAWTAYDSVLDLEKLNTAKANEIVDSAEKRGLRIRSLANLSKDKTRDARAYELHTETRRDAPMTAPASEVTFDQYVKTVIRGEVNPNAYFMAVKEDSYVGIAILKVLPDEDDIRLVWLGTEEDYRRTGVATTLLARAALYAKSKGYKKIHASYTSLNPQVASVVQKFGFTHPFGITHLHKDIKPPEPQPEIEPKETSDVEEQQVVS